MSKRKIRIGFDFDNVMNNLIDVWIEECNKLVVPEHRIKQADHWEMDLCYPTLKKSAFLPLYKSDFWDKVKPKDGAVDYIKQLIDEGHDVLIITNSTQNIDRKLEDCLFKHFPYLTWDNLVITKRKDVINVNILVDDYPPNLENSNATMKLLYKYSYNKDYQNNYLCVDNWNQIMDNIRIMTE